MIYSLGHSWVTRDIQNGLPPGYLFGQHPTILKRPAHRAFSPMMVGCWVFISLFFNKHLKTLRL